MTLQGFYGNRNLAANSEMDPCSMGNYNFKITEINNMRTNIYQYDYERKWCLRYLEN